MTQKTKRYRNNTIVRTTLATLAIVAGFVGIATHTATGRSPLAHADTVRPAVEDTKAFNSPEIGIQFTYPTNWKLARESSEQIYTYRLYSPDYAIAKDFIGNTTGHSGTIISIVSSRQPTTLEADKIIAANPANVPLSSQFKDFQHKGRNGFMYSTTAYGGLGRSLTTELNNPNGHPVKISIQFNEKSNAKDDSNQNIYKNIVDSVNYMQ